MWSSRLRSRYRPSLQTLESRVAMSYAPVPANTLAIVAGAVSTSGSEGVASFDVAASNLSPGRSSTLIGIEVEPAAGSAVQPRIVAVENAAGQALPLLKAARYIPNAVGHAVAFVQDSSAGPLTVVVAGSHASAGVFNVIGYLPGDVNGTGAVTIKDLTGFQKSYYTTNVDAFYNPAADANRNGAVGYKDAQVLVRNEAPLGPKTPVGFYVTLAPQDRLKGPTPMNSGGVTAVKNPTLIGRTTPGSIVLLDGSAGDYKFTGGALATDAQGRFSVTIQTTGGFTNVDFLVLTPYGQQKLFDYPIVWTLFDKKVQ